ncbi:uncharacterized protein DFL_004413 [Arthrobotrys flagrans]|uniref:Uncharacterized protein n=1 Tax=Arthrobotrys flagrans TaxID=97331 RepID=A0A437A4K9_ARTFL|nr:hypothetical protein DFL_004413 [Arthrobotrys flagrans]
MMTLQVWGHTAASSYSDTAGNYFLIAKLERSLIIIVSEQVPRQLDSIHVSLTALLADFVLTKAILIDGSSGMPSEYETRDTYYYNETTARHLLEISSVSKSWLLTFYLPINIRYPRLGWHRTLD